MAARENRITGTPDVAKTENLNSRVNGIQGNPNAVVGDPDELVSMDWSESWNGSEAVAASSHNVEIHPRKAEVTEFWSQVFETMGTEEAVKINTDEAEFLHNHDGL
ncbi:hypothetical protein B2J88_35850 [Rhodococcus sp. SRB_17]|nr:hypothetical protein [Rhodococcus sp. SRB_17]